jgi:hypothetical protein
MSRKQIGTVEITRVRVYPLDPYIPDHVSGAGVIVEPGEYPVYLDGISYYWRMTGVIDHASYRIGDGAFAINQVNVRSDDDVVFYSQRYEPNEFRDLVSDFGGMANPALVFKLTEDIKP